MIQSGNSHLPDNRDQLARASLAWLIVSAAGESLAALVVAGVVAGRLGLPLSGGILLAAAAVGALPRLVALARRQWSARWAELLATLAALVVVGGVGLALAWPSLLPLGR